MWATPIPLSIWSPHSPIPMRKQRIETMSAIHQAREGFPMAERTSVSSLSKYPRRLLMAAHRPSPEVVDRRSGSERLQDAPGPVGMGHLVHLRILVEEVAEMNRVRRT